MCSLLHNDTAKSIHSLLDIFLDCEPIGSPLSIFVNLFCPENAMITIRISNDLANLFGLGAVNEVYLNELFQCIEILCERFVLKSAYVIVVVVGVAIEC